MVVLDPDHVHSPFPAPFLVHEMRTRGFHPWFIDLPIHRPLQPTYIDNSNTGGSTAPWDEGGSGIGSDQGGGIVRSGGGSGVVGSSGEPTSTGSNQRYLVLGNPFQDPDLLKSMQHQWQQLPNWKSATVEGLTWEGTAEENARQYIDLVGVSPSLSSPVNSLPAPLPLPALNDIPLARSLPLDMPLTPPHLSSPPQPCGWRNLTTISTLHLHPSSRLPRRLHPSFPPRLLPRRRSPVLVPSAPAVSAFSQ